MIISSIIIYTKCALLWNKTNPPLCARNRQIISLRTKLRYNFLNAFGVNQNWSFTSSLSCCVLIINLFFPLFYLLRYRCIRGAKLNPEDLDCMVLSSIYSEVMMMNKQVYCYNIQSGSEHEVLQEILSTVGWP